MEEQKISETSEIPVEQPKVTKKFPVLMIILVSVLILSLGASGFLAYQNMQLQKQITGIKTVSQVPEKFLNSYLACGCGCCGGSIPTEQCIYKSKGDNLERIMEDDKQTKGSLNCSVVGCSLGIVYKYCD